MTQDQETVNKNKISYLAGFELLKIYYFKACQFLPLERKESPFCKKDGKG
jgi:hypothetical protein